jgi:hypothetical protein
MAVRLGTNELTLVVIGEGTRVLLMEVGRGSRGDGK